MKLHLPITLLTAVLTTFIALPAQAVEAPEGYTTTYLNSPGTLENYSTLTSYERIAFILEDSQEITPTGADYWTSSTPLISGGNVFFGSNNSDSPVALSFKDGNGPAFYGLDALTFDTLSNLTFSTITDNDAAIRVANGTLTITNVNDGQSDTVDVLFKDIKNTSFTYGGAIYAHKGLTISNNGDVSFSGNSSSPSYSNSYGGAIYAYNGLTISHNGNVSFSGNSSSSAAASSSYGGAIYAYDGDVTISNNADVSFSGNSSSSSDSSGGAIYASDGDVTISNNSDVSFSGNSSSAYLESSGGAICAYNGDVTISNNSDVSFSDNSSSSSDYSSYGGAIYASGGLTISNNDDVTFSGNTAYTKPSPHGFANGGAIYAIDGGPVTISDNSSVTFSRNTAYTDAGAVRGGAITTTELIINNNGDISFSENSATVNNGNSYGGAICIMYGGLIFDNNSDVSFAGNSTSGLGGAILMMQALLIDSPNGIPSIPNPGFNATTGLRIRGNNSVLFEKNYENHQGIYRLRSSYTDFMTLSAKTGGNITFYDSVYTSGNTYINSDYTDAEGNTTSAKGDVIFSGKHAEEHLNEILAANNENRTATAEEILNSQTSEIGKNVYVNGGSLQIVDGAVLKVNGNTVSIEEGSNATLAVSDAELVATNATIEVGASATLQLSNGASVTADEINIAAGATLAIGDIAVTTSAIDSMVAAYRLSSLNVINADLTFAAGSTLVTDGTGIRMSEGSILTFNATGEGEKINLVFTLGTEYSEDGLVQLFSNVDIVKFLMDGKEVDTSTTLLASDFFTGAGINENTTLHYDSTTNVVYLQEGVSGVVPEPTTATLSILALAALAMRRRRK